MTAASAFVLRYQLAIVGAACVLLAAGHAVQVAATRRRERRQDDAMIAAIRTGIETRKDEAAA